MREEHSRWHVRAVLLESCQGTKNVWSAHRYKLFRVSPEQLLMATITERVADDVIQKEFRTVSATDGQGFPKCLNVSRDLPVLPADKSVQSNPEERAERRDLTASETVTQRGSAQSGNTENKNIPDKRASKEEETEVKKSAVFSQRTVGKRTVDEDALVHAKKERSECANPSLARSLPEAPTICQQRRGVAVTVRMIKARDRVSTSCRRFPGRIPLEKYTVWPSTTENRKRKCSGERNEQRLSLPTPLPDDDVEILWNELVEHDGELIEEWEDELRGSSRKTTEKLQQGAANKGNEKGSNVHGKSLIWAAKRH